MSSKGSELSEKVYNKSFDIDSNQQNITSISFDLNDSNSSIKLEMRSGTEIIKIGNDEYKKDQLNYPIPFAPNSKKHIASNGTWTDLNEYQLRIYFYESPARLTYTFNFDKNLLTWESKADQALFGRRGTHTLIGR